MENIPFTNGLKYKIIDVSNILGVRSFKNLKSRQKYRWEWRTLTIYHNNIDVHCICYVRFIYGNYIVEDLPLCKSFTAGVKAQDLFEILDTFKYENNLEWTNWIGVCTDGFRSMSDYCRHLFESKSLLHCGPIKLFTGNHSHQNI